jgi:hypothetical protein
MPTLKEYLFASGVLEYGTLEEIEELKREFRKNYLYEKVRAFRSDRRSVSLTFPLKDAATFEKNAAYHNMKLAAYIKACVYAYVNQGFIVPDNQQIQRLELLLRRIGNNVNQVARTANSVEGNTQEVVTAIQSQVNILEADLSQHLRQPLNLEVAIRMELTRNPAFLHRLRYLIQNLRCDDYQNAAP